MKIKQLLIAIVILVGNSLFSNAQGGLDSKYAVSGYFFHPIQPRVINRFKNIIQIGVNKYQVELGNLGPNGYYFQFDVDANNNLINWVPVGTTPATPSSGFMTTDNPGAFPSYPGATTGFVHSIYNNTYNPSTHTFYLHYGYSLGSTSQSGYDRQIYEKCELTFYPFVSSVTPNIGSAFTQISITGKNFSSVNPILSITIGGLTTDSAVIISDNLIMIWPATGATGKISITNNFGLDTTYSFTYLPIPSINNPQWQTVGNTAFNNAYGKVGNIVIAPDNTPYISFTDSVTLKVIVMKYNDTGWVFVGNPVSDGKGTYPMLVIDKNNNPIVAYADIYYSSNPRITVKKFDGTNWNLLGNLGFTANCGAYITSIALDSNDIPYVVSNESNFLRVLKFINGNWVLVGNQSFVETITSGYVGIAIDKLSNTPYVIFEDYNNGINSYYNASVMKFDGFSWVYVGNQNIGNNVYGAYFNSIAIDKDGVPWIAFQDDDGYERISVYKLSGNLWTPVGYPHVSKGHSYYTNLMLDKNNKPYLYYLDGSYNSHGTVLTFNKATYQWETVGTRGFANWYSNIIFRQNSLAIDTNGIPFVIISDINRIGKLSVQKYNPALPCVPTLNIAINSFTNICDKLPVVFTATATNPGNTPVYQWKKNGMNVGNNSNSFNDSVFVNNDSIWCEITSNATCAVINTVNSNAIILPVNNNISGNIKHPTKGYVIPTVNTLLIGSVHDSIATKGNYSFNCLSPNGYYTIKPKKNNDKIKNNGVSSIDIILTQNHILNKIPFNNPYKIIAADVNNDKKVSAIDIIFMKRLILGIDTTFTGNRLWAFVDSAYSFPNPANPFPYKDSISYTGLNANKINQTFIGVKLGDVDFNWNPTIAKPSKCNNVPVELYYDASNLKGFKNLSGLVRVPIKVKNFKELVGMQYTLNFNSDAYEYVGIEKNLLKMDFNDKRLATNEGRISFLWADANSNYKTLEDGTVLFELILKPKKGEWGMGRSELELSNDITSIEAVDKDLIKHDIVLSKVVVERLKADEIWTVSPNPTTGVIKVNMVSKLNKVVQFELSNADGKVLLQQGFKAVNGENVFTINLKQKKPLPAGIYFLKAIGLEGDKVKRIVVR